MKMGDRPGMMIFTTVGKRVAGIDDLTEPLLSELRNNYRNTPSRRRWTMRGQCDELVVLQIGNRA